MHVVLLKSRLGNVGGLEKHTLRLAEGFRQKGCKVTLLTSGTSSPLSPYEIVSLKTVDWPGFLRIKQFDQKSFAYLTKVAPAISLGMDRTCFQTHIRAGSGVHAAYLQSRFQIEGRKKKWCCQINPLHKSILQIERKAFENPQVKKIFTNSYMVKNQILSYYKTDPKKIEVIHNGVEWNEMGKDFQDWEKEKPFLLQRFNLPADVFHFLFIGNGYQRKGLAPLLLALSQLKRRDFHLSVIGKERKMTTYFNLTRKLKLDKNVRFFGLQTNTSPFYQLADALVIPSYYDPFANVTIEALAMGLYVISSQTNGGHEILTEENGSTISNVKGDLTDLLEKVLERPKNRERATTIRNSVRHLDFSSQMTRLIDACLV